MKRILVLATTFPRWEHDTEPAFVYYLSQLLAERGFEITVLAPHAGNAALREMMGKLRVLRFPYFRPYSKQRVCYDGGALPNLRRYWTARLQLPFFLTAQAHEIRKLVRTEHWDLIHAHWIVPQGFFATYITRNEAIPVLLTAHAGDVFAMRHSFIRPFSRFALRHAALCTVNSNATVEAVLKLYAGSSVNLVPMGVHLGMFHPGLPDEELIHRFDLQGRTILGVGRFAPKKGFIHLVEAMALLAPRYPDLRLILVGFGPQEDELRRRVADLGLENVVAFPGRIQQRDLPRYYRTCSVFVLPSVVLPSGDTEGQGIVILEAMASGTPTVASRVGGVLDVINHEVNGLLTQPGDSQALADSITRVLDNVELAATFRERGLSTIKDRFSWESTADRFAELYREITE